MNDCAHKFDALRRKTTEKPVAVGRRFPFTPFPVGWFRVAASDELETGDVKPLFYFGRDLVLFRTESGEARVFDAHCPHLGAHLGLGGTVQGEFIQCPFHGWQFDGEGRCAMIPYANRKHRSAKIQHWPVSEVNGQIMVFYHPLGLPPDWLFPEWPEYTSPDWTRFHKAHRWRIRTHVQELGENGMDSAHFSYLHHQQTADMRTEAADFDGQTFVHRTFQYYNVFGLAKRLVDQVTGPLDITLHGLGAAINRTDVNAKIKLNYAFVFYFTPIDGEYVEVNSVLSMLKLKSRLATWLLMKKAIKEGRCTIEQDIPIWENKRYRERPALCDSDGPITKYRRWAQQFYMSADEIDGH